MKTKIVIVVIFLGLIFAAANVKAEPNNQAFIKYQMVGWQTYEFYVISNFLDAELNYEWKIDDLETLASPKIRYFFSKGEHEVRVKITDKAGKVEYDTVNLTVSFWSLRNNWFWWTVYFLVVILILYYWVIKIIYLFNKRRVSAEVRRFMDALDEHGFIERMIEAHLNKKLKVKNILRRLHRRDHRRSGASSE